MAMENFMQHRRSLNIRLQPAYVDDADFQRWARLILSLPLLPTYEVENMWLTIIGECPTEQYPTAQLLSME